MTDERTAAEMVRTHIPSDTLIDGEHIFILPAKTIQEVNDDDLIEAIKWFKENGLEWCDKSRKDDSDELFAAYEGDYVPRPRPQTKPHPGFVYAIQGETRDGFVYKIGQTGRMPDERLADFKPKLPFESKVYWSIAVNNMDEVERGLHQHFADYRVRGEWFKLQHHHLDSLDNLAMGYDDV